MERLPRLCDQPGSVTEPKEFDVSKGTVPILTCDHEDGCDVWAIDYYEMGVVGPRLPDGWTRDPNADYYVFCPDHSGGSDE